MSRPPATPGSPPPRRLAVLGHPIGHSLSPALQSAAFRAAGLPWSYQAWDVPPGDLEAALAQVRADPRWAGVNLTIPHKEAALALLDRIDPAARRIGAVNTVVREDGGALVGYNTDGTGFLRDLEEHGLPPGRLAGRRALVLGAGGAARAVVFALLEAGMAVVIANRTAARARALARELAQPPMDPGAAGGPPARPHPRRGVPGLAGSGGADRAPQPGGPAGARDQDCGPSLDPAPVEAPVEALSLDDPALPEVAAGCLLVVNATSAGMAPQLGVDPLPAACRPRPGQVYYDLVYRPAVTPFLARAAAAGARAIGGLGMLLHQGAAAFELWTNRPAPLAAMRAALQAALAAGDPGAPEARDVPAGAWDGTGREASSPEQGA